VLIGSNSESRDTVNRFLQTFCTVTASAVLVCGTLLLLTSTAPWSPRQQIDSEPSTPDSARLSTHDDNAIEAEFPGAPLASDQADTTATPELDEADRTYTASTDRQPDEERSQSVEPEAPAPEGDDALASLGLPLNADSIDTDSEDSEAGTAIAPDAPVASENDIAQNEIPTEVALSASAAPVAGDKSDAATDQIAEMLTTLPPRVIASDKSAAATDQIAVMLTALPPPPPPPVAREMTEPAKEEVAAVMAAIPPAPPEPVETESKSETPKVAVIAPPPPLPRRKPEAPPAPKVALPGPPAEVDAAPKIAAVSVPPREKPAVQEAPKQQIAQTGGGLGIWKPMALAPADKPSIALSKAPTARPSSGAYASKVWAALARHKPKAGQRGSTTVVFSIGENGGLRGMRVGRSSGNTRLDQLALATVRNAAPYPPPPSGVASYTIRIDFQ
jgi:protein TonB